MSSLKTYNINRLLASVQDLFELNDNNWRAKAIESIGRGLEILQIFTGYHKTSCTKTVENNRVKLPCHLESLEYIEYCGCPLKLTGATNFITADSADMKQYNEVFGELNPNYLHTSFADGEVTFYYKTLPLDKDGFPEIPDNAEVAEALEWFVIYKLMLSGYKHHTVNDWREAYNMWTTLYPRAQNSATFPTPEKMETFMEMWTTAAHRFDYGSRGYLNHD